MKNTLSLLLMSLLSTVALAQDTAHQDAAHLVVEDGYVRGLPPSSVNTAAYMRLVNHSDEALVLRGGYTDVAERVMIHETLEDAEGLMRMEHVHSVEVPAHGDLRLETGGLHLMLMNLRTPLRDNDHVTLILEFDGGLHKQLTLPVRGVRAEGRAGDDRAHDGHGHSDHQHHDH